MNALCWQADPAGQDLSQAFSASFSLNYWLSLCSFRGKGEGVEKGQGVTLAETLASQETTV